MTIFTIETTYHLPVYRQRSYEADSLEAADLALADKGWDDEKHAKAEAIRSRDNDPEAEGGAA